MADPQVSIRHDTANHRFVADIDGEPSDAVMKYRAAGEKTLDYYSTYTPDTLRGRGIAGLIVTEALDYALAEGFRVLPTCPYVARLIERNDKYRALVD